ncbi:hypothetical protein QRX50_45155 [Amycolatopsis carbonis]|uniref:Uncharacterized protein n=1 Tax=Amycolatopsis carbonis TaxID=715471 RepID=A0A9Y2IEW6_9PSEU|nr:hypothetical protein [Amycolatopsis sp. 2-15]WIX78467.1 hypothetical protein QRX50_45155 [Amycolatopsis sp. 2-15]
MNHSDPLAESLRESAVGADREMTGALVAAAYAEHDPDAQLAGIAVSAVAAGTDPEDILRACDAARLEIRTRAGSAQGYDDQAEDRVLDVMDRLTEWCHPDCRI